MMKDRFERFVVLPFSIGCSSESSVAVASSSSSSQHQTSKKPKSDQEAQPSGTRRERGENVNSEERTRTSYLPSFFYGVHKVIVGSFESLSQIFVYKEEIEEVEIEMEIGFPTDVKHVTHIGLDGSTTTNPVKGWDNLVSSEILTFPSLSLRQFELAMANQVDAPFIVDSSKFKTNKPTNC